MTHAPRRWMAAILLLTVVLFPLVGRSDNEQKRPANWAEKIERPGLPNLHKVDAGLYRGEQPTAEGIRELKKLGVKTIVCLRANHSDKKLIGKTDIAYKSIPLNTWSVKEKDIARFLRIATDENLRPVFVHCKHGADRTGTMCAAYRVAVEGWSKKDALDEMTEGGFGFHSVWKNLPKLIEKLDVDKVKRDAGLEKE